MEWAQNGALARNGVTMNTTCEKYNKCGWEYQYLPTPVFVTLAISKLENCFIYRSSFLVIDSAGIVYH